MRKVVSWAFAMTFLLGFGRLCPAQKPQPVVTISFSGYDEVMKDIAVIGKLGNLPQLGKMLEEQVQSEEPGKTLLPLIDKSKPWGAVLSMAASSPEPVVQAFVPVTDIKPLVKMLQERGAAPKELGGGVYELQVQTQPVLFTQKGSWLLLATSKEALDAIPADPATLLGGLNAKYTLAASAAIKNIPAPMRDGAVSALQLVVGALAQQPQPGQTPEQAAAQAKMVQQSLSQLAETVKDLDTILLGAAIDRSASAARVELTTTFLAGSKMAQRLAKNADVKSDMAGLADPSAAAFITFAQTLGAEEIAQIKANLADAKQSLQKQIDGSVPPADAALAKQVADILLAVVDKTIDGGKLDGGLTLGLAPKNVHLVAGLKIADGAKLNEAVKLVLDRAAKMGPDLAKMVKPEAETYQGVHFHVVSFPVAVIPDPGAQQAVSKAFGDKVELVLGVGDDSAFVALSSDAAKTLKGAIDKCKAASGKSAPLSQASFAIAPIVQFGATLGLGNPAEQAMIAQVLSTAAGQDHFRLTASPISNGMQVKVEIEAGLLRLLLLAAGVPGG